MRRIRITSRSVDVEGVLHENPTADAVWEALPVKAEASLWGEEVYFPIPVDLPQAEDAREVAALGELGYWPRGKAFCVFFGPTPSSKGAEIRAYSPVNIFGRLDGDARMFMRVAEGEEITVERVES